MNRADFPAGALQVLQRLEEAGYETCFVGGCVRDLLMGRIPQDFDLCTSALPEEMCRCLSGFRLLETGLKHGTLTVLAPDGSYEVTTFRTETGYSDMRHPDSVTFVRSLQEDLKRRDFTVNAMAWSPLRGLQDPFGGRTDLERRSLRCVGEPEARFREDALRILRAMRFSAKLGFSICPETAAAMEKLAPNLRFVSAERRFSELSGLFSHPFPETLISGFPGVLTLSVPGLTTEAVQTAAPVLAALAPVPEARFAVLLRDSDAPECLSALKCSRAFRSRVLQLLEESKRPVPRTASEMRQLLRRQNHADPEPLFALWAVLDPPAAPDARALWRAESGSCVTVGQLAVDGAALVSAGAAPGPALGRLLEALLEAVMEDRCENTPEALLTLARRLLADP